MKKRPYPKKREEERRVIANFSLSGETLRLFREAYALAEGHEPTLEEIREKARDLAFQGIGAYIKHHIEIEGAIIL